MTTTATAIPTRRTADPRRAARRTPAWWADASVSALVLSLLVVTGLWVSHRGLQELAGGTASALTSIGRLAGLLAADLMLAQLVLIGRIPWVERAFGQDRLAAWHRWVGFASFDLLLVHVVLITIGYAGTVHRGVLAEFWDLIVSYPGMLLAAAALTALIMVVVTSLRAARRKLRYESWHLMHLYAYLGVYLALPHQVWTGEDFVSSAWARAYWWTLYIAVAGAVAVCRAGLPAYRTLRHRIEVAAVVPEAPGIVSVYLRGRDLHRMGARAGQFLLWRFLSGPGASRAHPYSLSAPPRPDLMRITVKDLGDDSRALARLRPGTKVIVEGPYGRLTGEHYRGGGVTMVACGIGVTPLLAMLWELPYQPGRATLIYRARSAADLALRGEVEKLAAQRGVRVYYLLGPRASRASWLPAEYAQLSDGDALRRIVPDIAQQDVYLCGPADWMTAVRSAALRAGVPEQYIHHESFAW